MFWNFLKEDALVGALLGRVLSALLRVPARRMLSPHSNWKTSREKVFERTMPFGKRELHKWCEAFTCRGCVILPWSANSRPVGTRAPRAWDRRRQRSLLRVQETSPGVQCCDSAAVGCQTPFVTAQFTTLRGSAGPRPCQQHKAPVV